MPDVEKVIKGLKYIHDVQHWTPTESDQAVTARRNITSDAIALLKAQEPRVIRLQDAEAMRICWIETRHPHTTRPARIIRYSDDSPNVTIFSIHQNPTDWPVCEFGSEWRCWDKEPTNEQMEAVKWE